MDPFYFNQPCQALAPTRSRHRTRTPTTWTATDDLILLQCVKKNEDWASIANKFPGRTPKQVMSHWKKVANPAIIRGNWSGEEDRMIMTWVATNGPSKWSLLADKMPGRIAKQCRERWFNHLDPNINHSCWTNEEDKIIIDTIRKIGTKWAEIARLLPGRTDNSIKNRWNSTLKRRIDASSMMSENHNISEMARIENKPFVTFDSKINQSTNIPTNKPFLSVIENSDIFKLMLEKAKKF